MLDVGRWTLDVGRSHFDVNENVQRPTDDRKAAGTMPVSMQQLERRAYDVLRQKISSGQLQPGARLSEYAEAKALGTSRGPVREAVSKLASEGLVEKIPGIGVFVRTPADADELREVFEFRAALETAAAGLAAGRVTDQQLAGLAETCAADADVL